MHNQRHEAGATVIAPKADWTCTDTLFLLHLVKRNFSPFPQPFKNHEGLQEQKPANLHLE